MKIEHTKNGKIIIESFWMVTRKSQSQSKYSLPLYFERNLHFNKTIILKLARTKLTNESSNRTNSLEMIHANRIPVGKISTAHKLLIQSQLVR